MLVIITGVTFLLLTQTSPDINDSIGYVYAAERLAEGHGLTYEDPNNRQTEPFFFLYSFKVRRPDDTRMFFNYPPGFPILMAIPMALTGEPDAGHYLVPILAIAAIPLLFLLGKLLSNSEWVGFWSAGLVALAPVFWQFGTAAWSDVPSMVFLVAGVCLYLLSRQAGRSAGQVVRLSFLSGLLISYSFFIRQANLAILPALALYELTGGRSVILKERQRWAFYLTLGAGLALFFVFNHFYFGGAFITGYSPIHGWYPQPAFSLGYALGPSFADGYSLRGVFETLWRNFHILLLLVPLGWILLPVSSRLLVMAVTFVSLAPFAIYAFAPAGINSRFLIPAVPFLAVAVGQAFESGVQFLPGRRWQLAGTAIILLVLIIPALQQVGQLQKRNVGATANARRVIEITGATEPDAVFLTYKLNDHAAYYGGRSVLNYRHIPPSDPVAGRYRVEVVEPCLVRTVSRLLQEGKPVYYIHDTTPPIWDSLAILEKYFALTSIREDPQVLKVSPSSLSINWDGLDSCLP